MATIERRQLALKTGGTLTVRTAVPGDGAPARAVLAAAVAEGEYTLAEPGERATTAEEEAYAIEDQARRPGDLYLVAEAAGRVVGWLAFEAGRLRRTRHRGEFSMFSPPTHAPSACTPPSASSRKAAARAT